MNAKPEHSDESKPGDNRRASMKKPAWLADTAADQAGTLAGSHADWQLPAVVRRAVLPAGDRVTRRDLHESAALGAGGIVGVGQPSEAVQLGDEVRGDCSHARSFLSGRSDLSRQNLRNPCQGEVPVPVGHWLVHAPGDLSDVWPVEDGYFRAKYEAADSGRDQPR